MSPRTNLTRVAVVALLTLTIAVPSVRADEPVPDGVPSFNESEGCDSLSGIRGPLAAEPGVLDLSEPIYGPWADFYGRTVGLAWNQRVLFEFPTMSGSTKAFWVHQRVLPALQLALANLEAQEAQGNVYTVRTGDSYSWARLTIPPTRAFSFHAVGAALDINSLTNPYRADNVLITDMPAWFVDAWTSAGWCWGGDWVSIKDTMHYSWRGPLFTPGYVMPPPQPPLVAAAGFTATVALDVRLAAVAPSRRLFVTDLDRDGAPDVVTATPTAAGQIAIGAAPARNDFHWEESWGTTQVAPVDPGAPAQMADLTADGRPDLVYVLAGPLDRVSLEIHAHTGGGSLPRTTLLTAVPYQTDARYLFDDYDRDGRTDLFVIRPGTPATLEVWDGADFASQLVTAQVAVLPGDAVAIGDRDVDGVPDLYALGTDGQLDIFFGDTGYAASTAVATGIDPTGLVLGTGDLDGDGHTDLFLVAPDGSTVVHRGGASIHDPGVWYRLRTHHITRLSGSDRYATAAAVARASHPGTAETVFVATGINFPDALAGSAIAAHLGAPLLLVTPDAIPAATASELARLDPGTIVILGGEGAVSPQVQTALSGYGTTLRLAGGNRYETAAAISEYGFPRRNSAEEVVITSGLGFADALAGGPAAAALGGPLLLTEAQQLSDATRDEIVRLSPSRIVVLGGTAAVSDAVLQQLSELAPTIRIAGADRYETAVLVSQEVFPDGAASVYLSTGADFPDGLTGGAAAGMAGVPILLTMATSLPAVAATEIVRLDTYEVFLLGGESAIAAAVASVLETLGM